MLRHIKRLVRGVVARSFKAIIQKLAWKEFADLCKEAQFNRFYVFGPRQRLFLHATCQVNDAIFNVNSGTITVGEHVFFGHGVNVITGRHDMVKIGEERRVAYVQSGCDIVIEEGVWIGTNATIIGPCRIGKNAVVGAMCLVRADVPSDTLVAGVPARHVRYLKNEQYVS